MGSWLTNLWWGGDPDLLDPVSGMSLRDVYNVKKTWTTINSKSADYGKELFFRLFRKDPETQNFFKSFRGLTEHEIAESFTFQAHVQTFMASFNTAVVNLNQPRVVVALMNKLGTQHKSRRIEQGHFEELKEVLVDFLVNDLKLSESDMISWSRFVSFIYSHIYERLNSS